MSTFKRGGRANYKFLKMPVLFGIIFNCFLDFHTMGAARRFLAFYINKSQPLSEKEFRAAIKFARKMLREKQKIKPLVKKYETSYRELCKQLKSIDESKAKNKVNRYFFEVKYVNNPGTGFSLTPQNDVKTQADWNAVKDRC